MASMAFIDEHNEIAMLQKPKQADGFHQIVDFLKTSLIAVCDKPLSVSEEVIRICLRLDDAACITSIPNEDLFSNLSRMGYGGQLGVFKFSKAKFYTQWRFLVHTLMHCISKKTTGWSEFSSTIAYALVCLATARKNNFSKMIFTDHVSNLGNKKKFYMYPRFVQVIITKELTDMPQFDEVYVPKIPKGKVFSNMKRFPLDSEGVDTPLFSTMMVVSHNEEGMTSGSRPSLDHPTDSQSQPSITISIPQSLFQKPTSPITNTYIRKKVKKAPSLLVPSPTKPLSPLMENSPLENIYRETTGVSPNPKEVLNEEMYEHMGEQAATTPTSTEEDSGNINKTSLMATLNEQSFKGPRCQETKGVEDASPRQKTSTTKGSHDPSKGGNTLGEGEDRYDYNELMETMGNINMDVIKQGKDIEDLKMVILSQQVQITKLKNMVKRLVQKKRRKQFVLKRRKSDKDASNKGENQEGKTEKESTIERGFDLEGEKEAETVNTAKTVNAAETIEAAVTELSMEELEIAETLKRKERSEAGLKDTKGKAKMVEFEKPSKKKNQVELDEEVAKQLQAEMEREEQLQSAKDRELALDMAKKLNEEYQKSMQTAAEVKRMPIKK
ncbi:hypothetical protein L6452_27706 [Arctium lappa]|uniref:Uncharacterized protein n=1 Tax=Arctium lappa TaxID=4217 RepID=A0ACB8ZWY4_ARCLA|nr:hypothetical protein L6452_27706 [Arctium lappa]